MLITLGRSLLNISASSLLTSRLYTLVPRRLRKAYRLIEMLKEDLKLKLIAYPTNTEDKDKDYIAFFYGITKS